MFQAFGNTIEIKKRKNKNFKKIKINLNDDSEKGISMLFQKLLQNLRYFSKFKTDYYGVVMI